eukprot:2304177-Rhodomonas_salina.3
MPGTELGMVLPDPWNVVDVSMYSLLTIWYKPAGICLRAPYAVSGTHLRVSALPQARIPRIRRGAGCWYSSTLYRPTRVLRDARY